MHSTPAIRERNVLRAGTHLLKGLANTALLVAIVTVLSVYAGDLLAVIAHMTAGFKPMITTIQAFFTLNNSSADPLLALSWGGILVMILISYCSYHFEANTPLFIELLGNSALYVATFNGIVLFPLFGDYPLKLLCQSYGSHTALVYHLLFGGLVVSWLYSQIVLISRLSGY